MSLRQAIPGELLSSIARFRFAHRCHPKPKPPVRLPKISERLPSQNSSVSPLGFTPETSPREFRFVLSCAEYRNASALLQIALWPQGDASKLEEATAQLEALPTGKGRLWITDSRVTHAHDNVVAGNGAIEWIKFSVEIKLPTQN